MTWHPRGEPTWPDWREAEPGVTRVEHVRSGARGTFMRWPRSQVKGRNPGYAVIEWDARSVQRINQFNGLPYRPGPSVGRVVAYAFDLRRVT